MKWKIFSHRTNKTDYVIFNSHNCTACWKCVESCKQQVFDKIEVFNHRHARINEPEKCTGCLRCAKACGSDAIRIINFKEIL